jgi:hypothetical protein
VVVADGGTRDLLLDRDLMAAHRLELPYGFDPSSVPAAVSSERRGSGVGSRVDPSATPPG